MTDDTGGDSADAEGDANRIEPDPNALARADLRYPELTFPDDGIDPDGSIDLSRDLTREEMADWLDDLAGGLASHDVAIEATDGYATLGVAPAGVSVRFDPDEDHRGDLEISFRLKARTMFVADDPGKRKAGARGGSGFIPVEMLTGEGTFQCYNWIDDPTDP